MENFLADTSVWIDYFKGSFNRQVKILTEAIERGAVFFICPIIIQEILQGIKNDSEYNLVRERLLNLDILDIQAVQAALGAAELYRSLRKKGITINKSNDCLIAYYAIYFNIHLLHNDSDFDLIARNGNLKVI
jgi:predicted nucleic acid-binding protein